MIINTINNTKSFKSSTNVKYKNTTKLKTKNCKQNKKTIQKSTLWGAEKEWKMQRKKKLRLKLIHEYNQYTIPNTEITKH